MPLQYKMDVLQALRDSGYNTNRIRKERIMGEGTLQKLRSGEMVSAKNLEILCSLLRCQPGDIIEYVDTI